VRLLQAASGPPMPERESAQITVATVQRHFPGASVWRGPYTGSWWATHPALGRLVEAASLGELAFALRAALAPTRIDGRWTAS
jgi:hypothetical protein